MRELAIPAIAAHISATIEEFRTTNTNMYTNTNLDMKSQTPPLDMGGEIHMSTSIGANMHQSINIDKDLEEEEEEKGHMDSNTSNTSNSGGSYSSVGGESKMDHLPTSTASVRQSSTGSRMLQFSEDDLSTSSSSSLSILIL